MGEGQLSEEWKIINNSAKATGREVIKVAGDGHCLLHAVMESLQSEGILDITHDALCAILWQKVQDHKDYYTEYLQATSDVETDIKKYIKEKSYNNESGDIIVPALCNALK